MSPRENRTCPLYKKAVEDEAHFILECPMLSQQRERLFVVVGGFNPCFRQLPVWDQLKSGLSNSKVAKPATSIIYMFMERRAFIN